MSTITVVGNLTGDPEVRVTASGQSVANLTIAENHRRKDTVTGEYVDDGTTFWNAAVWRDHAANVADSLNKGDRVIVTGRVKNRAYEDRDGNKRTSLELAIDEIGPALKYHTATVAKAGQYRPAQAPTNDPWAAEAPF